MKGADMYGELCRECLMELTGTSSEVMLYSGADEYFREYGTGLACPCCGSELTTSDVSSRACAMCGDMVSLEFLLKQVDGLVTSWQTAVS
jgi:hypothetical protein